MMEVSWPVGASRRQNREQTSVLVSGDPAALFWSSR